MHLKPGLHSYQLEGAVVSSLKCCLKFLDSRLVSVIDHVCFFSVSLTVFLTSVCLCVVYSLRFFFFILFRQCPQSNAITEKINFHMFCISISVTGRTFVTSLLLKRLVPLCFASPFSLLSYLIRSLIR